MHNAPTRDILGTPLTSTSASDRRKVPPVQVLPDAAGGARTHDLRIKSPLLYQLSYGGAPSSSRTATPGESAVAVDDRHDFDLDEHPRVDQRQRPRPSSSAGGSRRTSRRGRGRPPRRGRCRSRRCAPGRRRRWPHPARTSSCSSLRRISTVCSYGVSPSTTPSSSTEVVPPTSTNWPSLATTRLKPICPS